MSLQVTGNVPFAGSGLQVRAQGTAPLGILPVGSSADLALAGTIRIDVSVTGSTSRPSINGTFDLVDARAADASDGIGVDRHQRPHPLRRRDRAGRAPHRRA